jgi:GWxTD domain-containing protein
MKPPKYRWTSAFLIVLVVAPSLYAQRQTARNEPGSNAYYRKWLVEDVYWIITEEERDVFIKLNNDDERDAFIEQFWARRDPDPSTIENEFKVEHYLRVMYANENFTAGIAGWKTDRGMIYIKFGPPDRIETRPAGGPYERERKDGGGFTSIFPIVRWEYRHIDGVGDDVELEFVDDKGGGLFELTFDRQRKDALLLSGLMGLTQDELEREMMSGTTNKQDRVARRRYSGDWKGAYAGMGGFESHKDKPLQQISISAGLNRPPAIKFKDLEAVVSARITYDGFPFDVRHDFIRLTEQQVIVPVTVLLSNEQMTFKQSLGIYHGGAQIFGRVVGLGNRVEAVFEDEVAREFLPGEFEQAKSRYSVHQKRLILRPGLYKLEIAVKDLESKRIGTLEQRLEVPRFTEGRLQLSSILLAANIEPGTPDRSNSQFMLGDLKVIPKTNNSFRNAESLGLYIQIYNFAVDPHSSRPTLKLEYAVAPRGREPETWRDSSSMIHYAGQYCRLARMVNLSRQAPGPYELRVRVRDIISGQSVEAAAPFAIQNR